VQFGTTVTYLIAVEYNHDLTPFSLEQPLYNSSHFNTKTI